jgi:hypothetical protein
MAFATLTTDRAPNRHDFAPTAQARPGRSLMARMFAAVVEARRQGVEREITAYLQGRGQFLTDETEREIDRILSARSGF